MFLRKIVIKKLGIFCLCIILISCTSTQNTPHQNEKFYDLKETPANNSNDKVSENYTLEQKEISSSMLDSSDANQILPDISYFATNKSDRFFVDFEDIVAAHPYV